MRAKTLNPGLRVWLAKKLKIKNKKIRPTGPALSDHVTGNQPFFLFGLIEIYNRFPKVWTIIHENLFMNEGKMVAVRHDKHRINEIWNSIMMLSTEFHQNQYNEFNGN